MVKITKKQLQDGFDHQKNQIEDLISMAETAYSAKKYNISTALSILALEEITKLRQIRDSDNFTGEMELSDWQKLSEGPGVHVKKLAKPIEEMLNHRKGKSSEYWDDIQKFVDSTLISGGGEKTQRITSTYDPEAHYALNQLKQDCLYMDFKDGKWYSAKLILSKNELEALAYTTLKMAQFNFNDVQLHNRHREIEVDPDSESYKNYVNDPLFKKRIEFQKLTRSNSFLKQRLIADNALKKFKRTIRKSKST